MTAHAGLVRVIEQRLEYPTPLPSVKPYKRALLAAVLAAEETLREHRPVWLDPQYVCEACCEALTEEHSDCPDHTRAQTLLRDIAAELGVSE